MVVLGAGVFLQKMHIAAHAGRMYLHAELFDVYGRSDKAVWRDTGNFPRHKAYTLLRALGVGRF